MKINTCAVAIPVLLALSSVSCRQKSKETETVPLYPVTVTIENVVNGAPIELNTSVHHSAVGHEYTVSQLRYFLSNFQFVKTNGQVYTVPQDSSYFLVNQNKPESLILPMYVEEGEYKEVRFLIGVDSLRNTMDITERQGTLDPAGEAIGMYWGWNSGYIHFILDGRSPDVTDPVTGIFSYHIGGFGGYTSPTINNIKAVSISLEDEGHLKTSAVGASSLNLTADIQYVFINRETNAPFNFAFTPSFMFDEGSVVISDNYQHLFSHQSTENK